MKRALLLREVPGWNLYALLYELDPPFWWEGRRYSQVVVSPIRGELIGKGASSVVDVYGVPVGVHKPTPDSCKPLEAGEIWGTDWPEDGLREMGYEPVAP